MGILHDSTRFCEKCGEKMNENIFIDHYDKYTGQAVKKRKYYCPMGHYVFEEDLLF